MCKNFYNFKSIKKSTEVNFSLKKNLNILGFTMVEIIIAIMIIGILAGILWSLLNPGEIFSLINNSKKENDIKSLAEAFEHYALDNQGHASEISSLANNQPYMVIHGTGTYNSPMDCNQVVGNINTTTISSLFPAYLATMPIDSSITDASVSGSGYFIMRKGAEVRAGACIGDYDFGNGLVALWHMNESSWSGAGVILDAVGTNHLTAANVPVPTSTAAKMGAYAGDFNVTPDAHIYFNSPTGLPSGDVAKTIMVWAKPASACTATDCVMGGFGNTSNGQNFQLSVDGAGFAVMGWGGGYDWVTGISNTIYLNNWHHYTVTYDPPTTNVYIDGVLKATTNIYTFNTTPTYVVLGNEIDKNTRKFQGQIDEFAVWSRALSEPEIKAIYNLEL